MSYLLSFFKSFYCALAISAVIDNVMRAAVNNPALFVAVATSGTILMLGSSLAHTLAKRGKNVKFSIGNAVKFEAEFHEFS